MTTSYTNCSELTKLAVEIPYSTKLWWEKTLVELELQENWQRKLWRLAEAKPIQYLSSRDLTTFWWIKLWCIGNEPPNTPKFSPAKVLYYTVLQLSEQTYGVQLQQFDLIKTHSCVSVDKKKKMHGTQVQHYTYNLTTNDMVKTWVV